MRGLSTQAKGDVVAHLRQVGATCGAGRGRLPSEYDGLVEPFAEHKKETTKRMKRDQQHSTESTTELAPHQAEVITALMRGASVTDATRQANVDRTTFYLWIKSDAVFQAELNRARQEQAESMRAQLRGLADTAVSTVREMLTGTDVPPGVRLKAALAVLQATGTLEPQDSGTTDPEDIERDQRRQSLLNSLSF